MAQDIKALAQGAIAFRGIFESLRAAFELVGEMRAAGEASEEQAKLVDAALASARGAARIAEAQLAQAFGYQLCKCEFPPVPMLTVGRIENYRIKRFGPVSECPKCGYNDAGPWPYERSAPPWSPPKGPSADRRIETTNVASPAASRKVSAF
jgi:hypothetical protein